MPRRSALDTRRSTPGRRPLPRFSTLAQAIGVKLRAFRVENRMAPLIARAIG